MRNFDELVGRYERNPIVVEAVRTTRQNIIEVTEWMGASQCWTTVNRFYIKKQDLFEKKWEGAFGDWIYKDHDGEFYLISAESFRELFRPEGIDDEQLTFDLNEVAVKGEPFGGWPAYDH